ncbi:MAG: serine hydrolase [Rikenellaceae bacterium]
MGNSDEVIYSKSYGYLDYSRRVPVESATLYDLASCTKALATTFAVMTLVDEARLSLDATVGELLEGGDSFSYSNVRVHNLLHHNSGFSSSVGVARALVQSKSSSIPLIARKRSSKNPYLFDDNYFIARYTIYDPTYVSPQYRGVQIAKGAFLNRDFNVKLDSMICAAYNPEQLGIYRYSDLNFYVLGKIVERITQKPLDKYVGELYSRMCVNDLGFKPLEWSDVERIAPTECDMLLRRDTVRGVVHDELAFVQGGVCGGAGLFGSAESVAQVCAMFLRGGIDYCGNDMIRTSTLEHFTLAKHFDSGGIHALGFDKVNPDKRPYAAESYGHAGFTGTYFWVDPTRNIYVVLLTNRVHPTRANRKLTGDYRAELWQMVCRGLEY